MTLFLVDSDAVMDQFVGYGPTVRLFQEIEARGDNLCVCSVVVSEVYAGLRPDRVAQARTLLDRCIYLETDALAARLAGEWRYAYRRQGIQLQTPDVLVAATSLQHGATLVTGNLAHYPMQALTILPLNRPYRTKP